MQENDVVFVGLFWSSFGSPFESPVWSARNGEPAQCQFLNLQLYVQVSGDGLAGAPSRQVVLRIQGSGVYWGSGPKGSVETSEQAPKPNVRV